MSAMAIQATVPYYAESLAYWDELTRQCRRQVNEINAVVEQNLPEGKGIAWRTRPQSVAMVQNSYPSTDVELNLNFEHWGTQITGAVRGYQEEGSRFYPEEFQLSICCDEDGKPIAITFEGQSLSPHDLAKYITQQFRRCYPGLTLPSPESAFNVE